jgi:alpha-mannosidase
MSRKNEEDVVTSRKRVLVTPHSHIDTEWYWSFSDTIAWSCEILHLVAERLRKDPAYRFGQDQVTIWAPVLARLDERDRKELIDAVTEGRIEPLGGMWTASELAEPGGESLVRQLQEGQRWMEAVLGRSARTAWFIDQFGQIPQLPQILAGAGFSAYVFGRDLPPDRPIDEFPADFWYVGPDGSRIQAHWMPGHYGDITD